ncbi:hypothetical protein VNO80_18388 [Phaseolus coccineus]|uniref:Uncharacterized protein n=1 Tax=Phaseolus coccineus TaxID=3886 RepID=A0AAN9QZF2_PHACN
MCKYCSIPSTGLCEEKTSCMSVCPLPLMHSSYACDSLSAVVMETQLREHVPSSLIGLVHRMFIENVANLTSKVFSVQF